jgi:hypothetical protein
LGSTPDARKGADLRRDPRCTLPPPPSAASRVPTRTGREAKIRDRCRSGHEGAECDGLRVVIAEVVHTLPQEGAHDARRVVDTRPWAAGDRPRLTVEPGCRAGSRARPLWSVARVLSAMPGGYRPGHMGLGVTVRRARPRAQRCATRSATTSGIRPDSATDSELNSPLFNDITRRITSTRGG